MLNLMFVLLLGGLLGVVFAKAFRVLPRERWQILATIPSVKGPDGVWEGINLTYYGLFNAAACTFAAAMVLVLLGAIGISRLAALFLIAAVLVVCMPASRLIARWVEKKTNTFSIGGAAFLGVILSPWIVLGISLIPGLRWGSIASPLPVLATLTIAYAFGEGIGRLACISFGCCYGKPLTALPPLLARHLNRFAVTFTGKTKKIAYAHGWEGEPVVPIQAITAIVYTLSALLALGLFLWGRYGTAYALALVTTQAWRFVSEFLRADDRGHGRISAYQRMALGACGYGLMITAWLPAAPMSTVSLTDGFETLWQPAMLLFLQLVFGVTFYFTGRSQAAGARLCFHVRGDQI